MSTSNPIRLVLLGGGHTNTQVIKHILKSNVADNIHLMLVSDYPISLYSGMCPGGVADQYKESELSIDLTACCKKLQWQFICKQISEIDDTKNILIATDGTCIKYDILSIDIGSTNLGISQYEGIKDYAITTRPLKFLMTKVNKSELRLFEKIKQCNQDYIKISIVIVGGGCAGCELSFALKNRLEQNIKSFVDKNALKIEVNIKCTLVTNAQQILMRDPKPLQLAVLNAMKDANIEIITRHKVVKMDKNCAYFMKSGNEKLKSIKYDICIWATGAAPHCMKTHNLAKHNGWFVVNNFLKSVSHTNIFAAGDCIHMNCFGNETLFPPKSGVYAVREGPILIHNLMEYVKHGKKGKFIEYEAQSDFLRLLNLCNGKAIGCKHGISFKGAWVWKLKDWIDVSWMNKFNVDHLLKADSKEFKPIIEENKENDIGIEDAVKLLLIDDEPNECNGFAMQWRVLLRMNDDEMFCKQVVELYKKMRQKNQ